MNQNANLALVEWTDNHELDKDAPEKYLPIYKAKLLLPKEKMYLHALPDGWEKMPCRHFSGKAPREDGNCIKKL
jgi:hypothetical protein